MNKNNIRSKNVNLSGKFIAMSKRKKIIGAIVIVILILGIILISVIMVNNNNHPTIKKEAVEPATTPKISVSTDTLFIKEWKLEVPVNGNILGKVTYTISDNNTKVIFGSSKLNYTDLSSTRCTELGITKDSWGVVRTAKKASYDKNKYPMIIGNYEYSRISPVNICSNVSKIDAAFNYLYINLKESK